MDIVFNKKMDEIDTYVYHLWIQEWIKRSASNIGITWTIIFCTFPFPTFAYTKIWKIIKKKLKS